MKDAGVDTEFIDRMNDSIPQIDLLINTDIDLMHSYTNKGSADELLT
jgi:hypothetical protein